MAAVTQQECVVPAPIREFLLAPTPASWVEAALEQTPLLLIDHANCELKAASSALAMIYRYPEREILVHKMSRLAREELRHYEQVRKVLRDRGIAWQRLSASRYARTLQSHVQSHEPHRLLDVLIVGALIEARSCERFALLVPQLQGELLQLYSGLLASEARHFENYLKLAKDAAGESGCAQYDNRLNYFREIEKGLAVETDSEFRFHSGVPATVDAS